jgi:FAD/FMN-containing dehydrogenase
MAGRLGKTTELLRMWARHVRTERVAPRRLRAGQPAAAPAVAPPPPSGHVVPSTAGDEYEQARRIANERLDFRPAEIVYCYGESDVVSAVRYGIASGMQICMRSGGHDYEGFSLNDGGLVIDVSRCDRYEVSDDRTTATVGPGTPLRTLYHRLGNTRGDPNDPADPGYTLPGGSCGGVGVGGLVTGGGFGLISRKYGLFCDRLVRVRLVDGTGTPREATRSHDPDGLLWATCGGGGGNFGVVTELEFELVRAPRSVTTFAYVWPAHDELIATVARRFTGWSPSEEMFATLLLKAGGDVGSQVVFAGQSFSDEPGTRAELAPVVDGLPPPLSASVSPLQNMSPLDAIEANAGDDTEHHAWKMASSLGRGRLNDAGIDALLGALRAGPSSNCYVQFDTFGGKINDVAPDATAFPHRDMTYTVQYQTYWTNPSDADPAERWLRAAFEAIDRHIGTNASYRNYCDLNLTDWEDRYYKGNYARLREIKARFDPHNVFHYPQSIVPA